MAVKKTAIMPMDVESELDESIPPISMSFILVVGGRRSVGEGKVVEKKKYGHNGAF